MHNVSTISTLESSLRSVTWFLPGRFKDAELASEARQYAFLCLEELGLKRHLISQLLLS